MTITDDGPPRIGWGNRAVPLFPPVGTATWALMNLLLTLGGLVYAIVTVIRALSRKRKNNEELLDKINATDGGKLAGSIDDEENSNLEEEMYDTHLRPHWLAAAIAISIAGTLLFMLTQDMKNMMVLVNWWTAIHAGLLICEILAMLFVFKKQHSQHEESKGDTLKKLNKKTHNAKKMNHLSKKHFHMPK